MSRSDKWLKAVNADDEVSEGARYALRDRLATVWRYAPLAAKNWRRDVEHIHQLRVATRRATAALQIFSDLVPRRDARWLKKRLRSLRHAAGPARDLDVLAARLEKIVRRDPSSRLGGMVSGVQKTRAKAQKPFTMAYKEVKREGFAKRSRALVKSVRWRGKRSEPTFAESACVRLSSIVDDFFETANADLSDIEKLHQMRIAGKQVRYGLELLSPAFDDSLRGGLYATFEEVQDKLGVVNDHASAIAMFDQWARRAEYNGSRAELKELKRVEKIKLETTHREFCTWWSAKRSARLEEEFASLVKVADARHDVHDMQCGSQREVASVGSWE